MFPVQRPGNSCRRRRRAFAYKQTLLKEAGLLVPAHLLGDNEDIFYPTFTARSVRELVYVDGPLIRQRKDAFRSCQAIIPPRVFMSGGKVISGAYRRSDLPPRTVRKCKRGARGSVTRVNRRPHAE